MKRLLLMPNANQQFLVSGPNQTTEFLDYNLEGLSVDIACTGTVKATSYQIPQLLDTFVNSMAFDISITAKYVDASNFCFILPAFSVAQRFPVFIEVTAYLSQALPGVLPSITVFLPTMGGVQSTFYDGTSSINITVGSIKRFSLVGLNTSGPQLWAQD